MDIAAYIAQTDTTAIYPAAGTGTVPALTYVALGLVDESLEVLEKELDRDHDGTLAELGDVAWYLARFHVELGVDPVRTFGAALDRPVPSVPAPLLAVAAGQLAGLAKKAMRDDACELTADRRDAMVAVLDRAVATFCGVNRYYLAEVGDTCAANAAKLSDRRERGVLTGSGDHR